MQSTPLVSILIPTYNRAHLIGETLDSVLTQTYTNWECIVVDDGSTDTTEELLHSYTAKDDRFQYHKRPDTYLPGGNGARNYGFELSKGTFVQWFDDDDIMLPDFLVEKISTLDDKIDLVLSPTCYWNPESNSKRVNNLQINTTLYQDYLCWNFGIITHSILFRKSFLINKKLFSDRIHRGQETEFFLRIFYQLPKHSYRILNKPLFLYRQHDATKSGKNLEYLPLFKKSEFIIYFENFVRIQGSENKETLAFCYHRLLSLFYSSIHNNDLELSKKIVVVFFPLLKRINYWKGSELILIGKAFILFNRGSFRIIKRWENFEF